ncbi:hypothetical protein GOODEAATRI_011348, partial [Goodea atripinnis]
LCMNPKYGGCHGAEMLGRRLGAALCPHRLSRGSDYELTARQGADTMAYIALLEEKLRPALVSAPTSLDAFVFGFLAPLHKADLTSSPLQSHLRQLDNLTRFCDNILAAHFNADKPCKIAACSGNIL